MISLDKLKREKLTSENCNNRVNKILNLKGNVINAESNDPIVYTSIGIEGSNFGTISDPDGSFQLDIPIKYLNDSITFSSIGYQTIKVRAKDLIRNKVIKLKVYSTLLDEVEINQKNRFQKQRIGWMMGKDGILPLDTLQGGGAVAMLMEAKEAPFYINKVMVRLMYNSKSTAKFRLHIFSYDSVSHCPGKELLAKEIILEEKRKFGWLRFDVSLKDIAIDEKQFFLGFEWLDDRTTRNQMIKGLKNWSAWKKEEFKKGNPKVKLEEGNKPSGEKFQYYKYHGNMMNWPGWNSLPPFTGLMIQTGKNDKTKNYRTFERKTSFSQWIEKSNTLNAVVQISY